MFKRIGFFTIFIILLLAIGCSKEPTAFEKQFEADSQKIKSKLDQTDNSIRNIEMTISTMKGEIFTNLDKISVEVANIKKTQTELRDTLNNLKALKIKTAEEQGKTSVLWYIIYLIIIIVIIWIFLKFFKGKSEEEEMVDDFTSYTVEEGAEKKEGNEKPSE